MKNEFDGWLEVKNKSLSEFSTRDVDEFRITAEPIIQLQKPRNKMTYSRIELLPIDSIAGGQDDKTGFQDQGVRYGKNDQYQEIVQNIRDFGYDLNNTEGTFPSVIEDAHDGTFTFRNGRTRAHILKNIFGMSNMPVAVYTEQFLDHRDRVYNIVAASQFDNVCKPNSPNKLNDTTEALNKFRQEGMNTFDADSSPTQQNKQVSKFLDIYLQDSGTKFNNRSRGIICEDHLISYGVEDQVIIEKVGEAVEWLRLNNYNNSPDTYYVVAKVATIRDAIKSRPFMDAMLKGVDAVLKNSGIRQINVVLYPGRIMTQNKTQTFLKCFEFAQEMIDMRDHFETIYNLETTNRDKISINPAYGIIPVLKSMEMDPQYNFSMRKLVPINKEKLGLWGGKRSKDQEQNDQTIIEDSLNPDN